jgi:copper(I)-binding protein
VKAGVKARLTSARSRGRSVGLGAVAAGLMLTSACAAGQYAQSATEQETIDGTSARVGTMTLGGLAIETPSNGVSWSSGSNVPLKVVVVNSGQRPDTLTSITSPQITGWAVYASPAAAAGGNAPATAPKVTVQGHSREQFGTEQFGTSINRVLHLTGLKQALSPGMAISLTFTFARAGTVTTRVPVQLSKSPQTAVLPGPSATGEQG